METCYIIDLWEKRIIRKGGAFGLIAMCHYKQGSLKTIRLNLNFPIHSDTNKFVFLNSFHSYIHTQYEFKRIKDLILKGKILIILQKNIGSYFYYLGLWQDF